MAQNKLMTAKEAIDKFVTDGDIVYTGYNLIPHSLCHEIIRQKKKNLTVAGASVPEMDALLYITGCSNRAITGYIGGAVGGTLVGELMEKGDLQFAYHKGRDERDRRHVAPSQVLSLRQFA